MSVWAQSVPWEEGRRVPAGFRAGGALVGSSCWAHEEGRPALAQEVGGSGSHLRVKSGSQGDLWLVGT